MLNHEREVMLDAQIDTDWDNLGDAGMLKKAYRPMAFFEERQSPLKMLRISLSRKTGRSGRR